MRHLNVMILLLAGLAPTLALSRTVLYTGKTETVTVVPGTPTIVRFERPVKTVTNAQSFVVRPASDESPDYATLAVDARGKGASSLATFILADGALVRVKFKATDSSVPPDGFDNIVDFRDGGGGGRAGPTGTTLPEVKAIDLMKAMIRGDKVMGYEVREVKKSLLNAGTGVEAALSELYSGPDFTGYVIHLRNASGGKRFKIDIRGVRIGEPNLAVLSEIDRDTLEPDGGETDLRIVARPGGVYKDLVLPVAALKREKGGAP